MKSKTSLFKKGIILSDFKRFWWVSALYALFLFFVLPFDLLMQDTQNLDIWRKENLLRLIQFSSGQSDLQIAMIIIVPVILAVLIFRYLHVTKATAMMHSLPLDRKTLYFSHNAAGVVLLVAPVLLNGLVLFILQAFTYLKDIYTPHDVFKWLGYTLLFDVLFFIFAVFIGMFTGNPIAQIAFTYIIHVLPMGLSVLFDYNLNRLLYGYGLDRNFNTFSDSLPIFVISSNMLESTRFTMWHVVAYIILSIILFAAALFVYDKRKLEAAGDIVSFGVLNPVFKYGVTFCTMLLGGVYFGSISGGSFPVILTGYFLSSLFGYCVAEMLMQKSFKVFSSYKGYLGYAALLLAVFIGLAADVTGFVHKVPNPEDVKKVYFGYSMQEWSLLEKEKNSKADEINYDASIFFENSENIKSITALHKQLTNSSRNKNGQYRFIIYTLKNGKYLIRQYPIDERTYGAYLKPLYESLEYKNLRFPVINQKPGNIKYVEIKDDRSPKKPLILANSPELREFTEALSKDIRNMNYENLILNSREYIYINIVNSKDKTVHYALRDSYKETLKLLKSKGYYDSIALLPNEIETITLEKVQTPSEIRNTDKSGQPVEPKRVEIKDRKVIEELFAICNSDELRPERRIEDVIIIFNIKGTPGNYQFQDSISKGIPLSKEAKEYFSQLGVQ